MVKYKMNFFNKKRNRNITKNVKTKAEMGSIARNFDKNKVDYKGYQYNKDKETGRFGWREYQPSNFCQICGRALTDPKSIQRGIGPICWGKNRGRISREFPETDQMTKVLNGSIAKRVIESIPEYYRDKCRFCEGDLSYTVYYYEHDGGWYIQELDKKVWLWVECLQCGHQWSLAHLRGKRAIIEV